MRNGARCLALLTIAAVAAWGAAAQAGDHRLGLGLHYWRTLDQIRDDGVSGLGHIKDSGVSQVASYQYLPSQFLKYEIAVEYFDKGFGGATHSAYSPQVYILFGRGIYAGVGIGATVSSDFDNDISKPFYAAKGGFEIGIFPRLDLAIEANYRVGAWKELEDKGVDTDTLTFGLILRVTL
jgi:hypothetical protein